MSCASTQTSLSEAIDKTVSVIMVGNWVIMKSSKQKPPWLANKKWFPVPRLPWLPCPNLSIYGCKIQAVLMSCQEPCDSSVSLLRLPELWRVGSLTTKAGRSWNSACLLTLQRAECVWATSSCWMSGTITTPQKQDSCCVFSLKGRNSPVRQEEGRIHRNNAASDVA